MVELEFSKYYRVLTNDYAPTYKMGHLYKGLCFQSNIHPDFYVPIKDNEIKDYLLEHFRLQILVHRCENKYCIQIKQIDTNNPCSWLWGGSFEKEENAWEYAYDKALKIIDEHNITFEKSE